MVRRMKINNSNIIRSVSFSQHEILNNIFKLHKVVHPIMDVTYGKGNFYKYKGKQIVPEPDIKLDLIPKFADVIGADSSNLPIKDNSVGTIIFDPPFLATSPRDGNLGGEESNVIISSFGYLSSMKRLWSFYADSMREFYRVLTDKGYLVFKCQDSISSGTQFLSHVEIINKAVGIGFYPKDLFIVLAKSRIISRIHQNQKHARKFHSYFLLFQKNGKKVFYSCL